MHVRLVEIESGEAHEVALPAVPRVGDEVEIRGGARRVVRVRWREGRPPQVWVGPLPPQIGAPARAAADDDAWGT